MKYNVMVDPNTGEIIEDEKPQVLNEKKPWKRPITDKQLRELVETLPIPDIDKPVAIETARKFMEHVGELKTEHKRFLKHYLTNGRNATQAYKDAYPEATSYNGINASAARLLGDPRIELALAEIKTLEDFSLLGLAKQMYKEAYIAPQSRDRQTAIMNTAKLSGLYRESQERVINANQITVQWGDNSTPKP